MTNSQGHYEKGTFFIYLNSRFDKNLNMRNDELGHFLHEYTHFLQNIATPFGIKESCVIYKRILNTIKDYATNNHSTQKQSEDENNTEQQIYSLFGEKINEDWPINIDESTISLDKKCFKITFNDNAKKSYSFKLGTYYIKEGMAYRIQSIVDCATVSDVPYNVLWKLCQKEYNKITEENFICICFLSLFADNPIKEFIRLCEGYKQDTYDKKEIICSQMLCHHYLKKIDCYVELYKRNLKKLLQNNNSQYIEFVLENAKKLDICKIIDSCKDKAKLLDVLKIYGLPIIRTSSSTSATGFEWHFPGLEMFGSDPGLVYLKSIQITYEYIMKKDKICPCISECDDKINLCYESPLSNTKECLFTEIIKNFTSLSPK